MTGELLSGLTAIVCPFFTEVHGNPDPMDDSRGEFFEIFNPQPSNAESLEIRVHSTSQRMLWPDPSRDRLVFCHGDSLPLLPQITQPCQPWKGALPNTSPVIVLLHSANCRDSSVVPRAIAGKSWIRVHPDSSWVLGQATPGFPDPDLDPDIHNRSPALFSARFTDSQWHLLIPVVPGDTIFWSARDLSGNPIAQGYFLRDTLLKSEITWPTWFLLRLELRGDDFAADNTWDTLLSPPQLPPLLIREIAPCPSPPYPEWWEIENISGYPLNAQRITICSGRSPTSDLVIPGRGRAVMTPDSQQFRQWIPDPSVLLIPVSRSVSLRNSGDTLTLCLDGFPVHQISWGTLPSKNCAPAYQYRGDNWMAQNNPSPGFEYARRAVQTKPRLNAGRLCSGKPALLRLNQEESPWKISFYDRRGFPLASIFCSDAECLWEIPDSFRGPLFIHAHSATGKKHLLRAVVCPRCL